jgi:RNA polymerase sigma factor (sigma-70 family)
MFPGSNHRSSDIVGGVIHPLHQPATDEDLLELQLRFQSGDVQAFQILVSPHLDALFTLCLRLCASRADAEDIAQEALARAYQKRSRYEPGRPLRAWLFSIATNLCRDHRRSAWLRRVLPLQDVHHDPALSPDDRTARATRDEQVRDALASLPSRYREALALYYLEEMTYSEMAAITGTSVPALKQRVRRGNEKLRDALTRLYPDLPLDRIGE